MTETTSETFLSAGQIRERYGVSAMWIERRLHDQSGFPTYCKLGRLRFWKLADIEKWERDNIAKPKIKAEKNLSDAA